VQHAPRLAAELAERIAQPLDLGDLHLRVAASVGVALSYGDDDALAVLGRADAAMYAQKNRTDRPAAVLPAPTEG